MCYHGNRRRRAFPGEGVMDNVKCHVREVGWGGQEGEGVNWSLQVQSLV